MFDRRDLKRKARGSLKQGYFKIIIISFLALVLINGGYQLFSFDIKSEPVNIVSDQISNATILDDMLSGFSSFVEQSNASKGILAIFANNIASANSFLIGTLNGFNQIFFTGKIGVGIIIFIGVIIGFLFWLFISNCIEVGRNRFFIEKIKYKETPVDRLLYVFRTGNILNVVKVMFFHQLYLLLWLFTFIGFFIKHYSYLMIPYILAENPKISKKDAFMLSEKMMDGNKLACFKLDVTFIVWKTLGLLTFNIVNLFFTEGYYQTVYANVYMNLRAKMLKQDANLEKFFIDKKLEEEGDVYPEVLKKGSKRKWLKVDFRKNYSISTLILLFFTFSCAGWLWEVALNLFMMGNFVNKGTLIGPWLPIYGFGGVLLILLLSSFKEKPGLVFILSIIICGIIEYAVSIYLELVYHMKWWDYSGFFLNINGRVCLEGLILFGFGGMIFMYIAAPLFDNIYKKIPNKIKIVICIILILVFALDFSYSFVNPNSGEGITTVASL